MPTTTSVAGSPPLFGAATIERHGEIFVVRDDLLAGGAKSRFVPYLVPRGATELVFGAPFCGGAPVALAVEGKRRGLPVTIFYAARAELSGRQRRVAALGANLQLVRPGYMTVVQARARAYAEQRGATFYPLGFDVPEAEEPFVEAIRRLTADLHPPEIWCASGSGMLARCIGKARPDAQVKAVAVGLASRWQAQVFPSNVEIRPAGVPFDRKSTATAPFPCCGHYDRKAWSRCVSEAKPGSLFYNVMGDE